MTVISAHEATIKTATVEIKALTVSGKQVTMGLFRQLEIERLIIEENLELAGTPWGKVNYFPSPCDPDHLHIVWQSGDELRRACVYKSASYWTNPTRDRLVSRANATLAAWGLASLLAGKTVTLGYRGSLNMNNVVAGYDLSTTLGEVGEGLADHYANQAPERERGRWKPDYNAPRVNNEWQQVWIAPETDDAWTVRLEAYQEEERKRLEARRKPAREALEKLGYRADVSVDDLGTQLIAATQRIATYDEKYRVRYEALAALDQLFIAV